MAIRPIKSISKSGENSVLKLFKSCREVDLCNLFSNLLVASLEHLITFSKGQGLAEYFTYVMSLVPQASNDDFQANYSEVFEDFEELFEKKQLKVLNSMIFDDSFLSFIINLQEMFEVRDSKSSHNEKLQLIEFYAVSMKINIMVLMDKSRKVKFCVDNPFVHLTLFDDGNSLFVLFPYEYRYFSSGQDNDDLTVPEEEDMRKNLHLEIENQDPLTQKFQLNSPGLAPNSPKADFGSPTLERKSIGRLSSPSSSVQLEENDFQKRMAQRARNFKEKRKVDIEKSPVLRASGQNSGDFSILSRNMSADGFFQSRFRDSILDDSKLMNFKGEITLDSKERMKWLTETELYKEEMLRREEIRKIEEKLEQEESKIKEIRRKEIENLIENVKNQVQHKRLTEEKRLEDHRRLLQLTREKNSKSSLEETLKARQEMNFIKTTETQKLLQEKAQAEQKIIEAQLKLEEAAKNFENLINQEQLRLAEEHEKRMQEEKIIAEKIKQEEEIKAFELEQIEKQRKLEEDAENERKRIEDERIQREIEELQAYEEELRRAEEEKLQAEEEKLQAEEEKLQAEEAQRIELERIAEEEKANKEKLRIQKIQEEKKKRAREEEEYLKNLKEKENEKKRIADEKKAETARKAEEKQLADQQKRIEEQKRQETQQKEEARRKKEEEDRKKKEENDRKKKEEEERKRKLEKTKQEEEKKRTEAAKAQEPEETYEETDNTSFCGGLYCAKCARELKRSNYLLKCDLCNEKYMKTGVASISPASSVPQCKTCMNCSAKITKGEEVQCMRCFIQSKIFGESFSPCTGCVRTDKCYWIDAGDAEERNMTLCGFCDEKKAKDTVIVICSNCEDMICLVCLRKNPFVIQGICSHCHNRRVPRIR